MSSRPTRWSPTPEQIMILEEMYQKGLKSPNTTQIQMITAHLSMYGKIEGKNVFYWFQNHKARDRQKLRKRLKQLIHHHHHHHHPFSGPTTTDEPPPPHYCPSSAQPWPCFPNTNDHLSCLDYSQPSSSSAGYLFQSTVVEEDSLSHQLPTTVDFHPQKTDLPQPSHTTTTVTGWPCTMKTTTYGQDSILMMEAGPTLPCWTTNSNTTSPLKTLQLFPTSSTK